MVGPGANARGLAPRLDRRLGVFIAAVLLGGCIAVPVPTARPGSSAVTVPVHDDLPAPTPRPTEPPLADLWNVFGPIWPSLPPDGARIKVNAALLTRDRQTLYVTSNGISNYTPDNPCSEEIVPWVGVDDDTLLVAMTRIPHPEMRTFGPNEACTMELITSRYQFLLPSPFTGSTIRDLAVGPIWVPPPDRVAEPTSLPDGWVMVFIDADQDSQTLTRYFVPDIGVPAPAEASFMLSQRFAGPSTFEIEPDATITIAGATVPVQGHGASWMASWILGGDGITLSTIAIDPSIDAFRDRAESVAIPNP